MSYKKIFNSILGSYSHFIIESIFIDLVLHWRDLCYKEEIFINKITKNEIKMLGVGGHRFKYFSSLFLMI